MIYVIIVTSFYREIAIALRVFPALLFCLQLFVLPVVLVRLWNCAVFASNTEYVISMTFLSKQNILVCIC